MANQYRGLATSVLIFSCLIIIGIGHGAVPMILVELMTPFAKGVKLSLMLTDNAADSIPAATLFFFIGQLLLFISTHKLKVIMRLIALVIIWIGFFFLVHDISNNAGSRFTFATGAPFLILSIVLFSFDIRQYFQQNKTNSELE